MSTPIKLKHIQEDNNNVTVRSLEHHHARSFAAWYKRMIDEDRQNLGLYISDDAKLEWFGRTIRSHKKITGFLKYDMQCSKHDFTTIESKDRIVNRREGNQRTSSINSDSTLATPIEKIPTLSSPIETRSLAHKKRSGLRSCDASPEWDPNSSYFCERERKRAKTLHFESMHLDPDEASRFHPEIGNKGDGNIVRPLPTTPPNKELGQGDCLPSTSTDSLSESARTCLQTQLPRKYVECNGYVEFTRTRNSRSMDAMRWDRKCKVQICYSVDPLNVGEYIIWAIHYSDESKCRRNLMSAFEEAAKGDWKSN